MQVSEDGRPLEIYEVPLIKEHSTGVRLRFYYTFHPDERKESWTTRKKHATQFRAFSLCFLSWEIYLDRVLYSMGFMIQPNVIQRILMEHHLNRNNKQKQ